MLPLAGGVGQPDMLLAVCVCVKAGPATDGVEVQLKACTSMCMVCVYV